MKVLLIVGLASLLSIPELAQETDSKDLIIETKTIVQNGQVYTQVGYLKTPSGILTLKRTDVATLGILFLLETQDNTLPEGRNVVGFSADSTKLLELSRHLEKAMRGSSVIGKPIILPDFTGEMECVLISKQRGVVNIVLRDNPNHLMIRKIAFTLNAGKVSALHQLIQLGLN